MGHSLKQAYSKGNLVPSRKQTVYQLPKTESDLLGPKRVLRRQDLVATDNTTVVSYINKEGGIRSGLLCAILWGVLTWCSRKEVTLKAQHITGRVIVEADRLSMPDHPDRVVSPSRGLPVNMQQMAPTSDRSMCHKIQQ